jgi:hypothetical protein
VTVASVFLVGGLRAVVVRGHGTVLGLDVADGVRLVVGLLSILLAHEMGHYLAARYYGVDATLPYFIPFPVPGVSLVGTLGAFIRIRGPIPNRRALFDIGVAGRSRFRLPPRAAARRPWGSSAALARMPGGRRASRSVGPRAVAIPDDQTSIRAGHRRLVGCS